MYTKTNKKSIMLYFNLLLSNLGTVYSLESFRPSISTGTLHTTTGIESVSDPVPTKKEVISVNGGIVISFPSTQDSETTLIPDFVIDLGGVPEQIDSFPTDLYPPRPDPLSNQYAQPDSNGNASPNLGFESPNVQHFALCVALIYGFFI